MTSPQPDVFVALYTQHQPRLFRYVATLLPRREDVDDVLQETSRVLWQKFDEFDTSQPFLPWAYKIARYEVLNHLQRQGTQRKYFSGALVEQLATAREENGEVLSAQAAALRECIAKLTDADRQLVKERYVSEGSMAELAELLGRTPNALYKSLQRIRGKLFECVTGRLRREGLA